jgi:dTDP-4-dehydrorhamnose 3,5-epimerase
MTPLPTPLPGLVLLERAVFRDARGHFTETFQRDRYRALGIEHELVQDNMSRSLPGVLRGLHYRVGRPEGKLVHVTRGEIFDVVVDIRRSSPTLGRWFGTLMSEANHRQLWIPPGFAHGFLAITEADVAYKVSEAYSPPDERTIRWDDPELAIAWPLAGAQPLVSAKDAAAPVFAAAELLP